MIIILLLVLILIYMLYGVITQRQESFCSPGEYMSIVDPYSIPLWLNTSAKEDLWNYDHTRKFYYYRDMVPQKYKE